MATIRRDLRQRDFERYEELFNEYGAGDVQGLSRASGAIVRAAAEAGWFDNGDVPAAGIPDMKPGAVLKLAREVLAYYAEAGTVDPNE